MTHATNTSSSTFLNDEYRLDEVQVASYQRDGHVLLRRVASRAEVEHYRKAIVEGVRRHTQDIAPLSERNTYGKAFLQVGNIWTESDAVAEFVLAKRFGKIAADLMGVDGVRLYHDQALFKEGGGGLTPWHQDQQYWPLDGVKTVTMWMPLVDADEAMGTMRFASGSHKLEYLGPMEISDESEVKFAQFVAERGFTITGSGAMAAGDATFHSGWTLHGAPGNSSTRTREVMTIIYFEDGARVSEPDNPSREADLKGCFPGLRPGDLAATEINPLVYRREG